MGVMTNEIGPFHLAFGSPCFTNIGPMLTKLRFQLCTITLTLDN